MLSKELIAKVVAFDMAARMRKNYDLRRYGTLSRRELMDRRHVTSIHWCNPTGRDAYWDAAKGSRIKDGAPTRKTLRYNVIVPDRAFLGKNAEKRNRLEREVMVYHVAVRLNRNFLPVIKDVSHYSPKTKCIEYRDMGYHQLGGWIVYWNRSDYDNKAWHAYFAPPVHGTWYKEILDKWRGRMKFPYHETVNVEDLKGTRYEWCQYQDGLGVGLCDWLTLYREEPQVETLAKAGLHDLITPVGVKALKDKRIFQWVRDRMEKLAKKRFSVRDMLWAARHGKELKDGRHHFELIEDLKYTVRYNKVRFDYKLLEGLLKKWHISPKEYGRYVSECKEAGLDLRNYGTKYPPTSGGRKAFMARLEEIEDANAKRAAEERRRDEETRIRRVFGCTKAKLKDVLAARASELEAFQNGIEKSARFTGCGYQLIVRKSQEELLKEGKLMSNCVGCGTYGEAILCGKSLIVTIASIGGKDVSGRKGSRFCVEIDRKTWKVKQCYGRHNQTAPEGIEDLAKEIAAQLKAQYLKIRKQKRFGILQRRKAA